MTETFDEGLSGSAHESLILNPNTPESKAARALKMLAYAALFLAALLFFMALKLPNSLVSNSLLNSLNSNTPYRWQAEKITTRFLFLPHLEATKLTMESKYPGGLPPVTFDTFNVYPTLWSLLPLTGSFSPRVSFDGSAYQASLRGAVRTGKNMDLSFTADNLDLAKLRAVTGGEMKGLFDKSSVDIYLPGGDQSQADGTFEIHGKNVVLDPSLVPIPLPLPILDVGTLEIRGKITKGKVDLERVQMGAPGKDVELKLSGDIRLNRNPALSELNLHLLLKPSARVLESMPSLKTMLGTIAAARPDGFYAMKFSGPAANAGIPQPDK